MVAINWDAAETPKRTGAYHVEVLSATENRGKASGEPYFMVTFGDVERDRSPVCDDVLSFSPKAIHMTLAKLKAMGFDRAKKNIEADHLVGRRCHIMTKIEQSDKYGDRQVVDIKAEGYHVGYLSESDKAKLRRPLDSPALKVDEDIPF